MGPLFLTRDEALAIHADMIERYGGSDGLRDSGLLDSAIAQPKATFDGKFLCGDIASMAATYLFHIAKNHPFIDGNKRVAAVAAIIFLELNDYEWIISEDDLAEVVLSVASGGTSKAELIALIQGRVRPINR